MRQNKKEMSEVVSACPAESDPRKNVGEFVRDRSSRYLTGLREEGLEATVQVLTDELKRQRANGKVLLVDREFLCDNGIDFARELESCLDQAVDESTSVLFTYIPVKGWETAAERCRSKGADVFFCDLACRQVPLITRILGP